MPIYKMQDIIEVTQEGTYPLNLLFKTKLKDPAVVNGPGIYIIAFEDQPIYVGKYQPMTSSIFNRWLKSFVTLTFRGSHLGFGGRARQAVLTAINAHSQLLVPALDKMPPDELTRHFRDTGVNTSVNGTNWVASKWDKHFSKGNDISVAKSLSFAFIKLTGCTNQEQSKAVASALEQVMFDTYNFEINFRSKGTKPLTSLDDAVQKALNIANEKWPDAQAQLKIKLVY